MHPYEMQRLIGEWHKDEFLDLKRGSLYHAIKQLLRQESIEAVETQRVGKRPERTIYRLTHEGERRMHQWLGEMLSKPVREPTSFFAALSFLPHLEPESVRELLQERIRGLEAEIGGLESVLKTMTPQIGRLPLVEVEYVQAMRRAELAWVQSLLDDLRSGSLNWNPHVLLQLVAGATQSEPSAEDVV
jgi:DNA-binding PadR family transcriptional regulator